jgi:hypothetical protein
MTGQDTQRLPSNRSATLAVPLRSGVAEIPRYAGTEGVLCNDLGNAADWILLDGND